MGIFVNSTDFTDKFELSTGMYSNDNIDAFILRYEERYLIEMLGIELYNEFKAEFDSPPISAKFQKIYYPFNEQLGFTLMMSRGVVDMLKGFIYFEYLRDLATQTTNVGVTKPKEQNSSIIVSQTPIYLKYNESITTYRAIQEYIMLNMGDYSSFRGLPKQYAYWI